MLDKDIQAALTSLLDNTNPEIHHYRHGVHPGYKWYIKTIVPGPTVVNDDTYQIWISWKNFCEENRTFAKLTPNSYDWSGNLLHGWWTLWLDTRIDVSWNWRPDQYLETKIINYDQGLKNSADSILEWLKSLASSRQSSTSMAKLLDIEQVAEFIKTWTDERSCLQNRKKFKVIDNEIRDENAC